MKRRVRLEAVALPIAWLIEFLIFGLTMPDTFLTFSNISSMLSSQAVLVVLALGALAPLTVGDFDLSCGSVAGLSAMMVAVLNGEHQWNLLASLLVALLVALAVGALNVALSVWIGVDTLIVTLGTGTLVAGVTAWISNQNTISGVSSGLVDNVIVNRWFNIPVVFYYGLILAAIIGYVLVFTPIGRRALIVGQSRDVAQLSGIRVGYVRAGAMMTSALISGLGGLLYVGISGSASATGGAELLLPAYAAAFLGATTITPGRFNAPGTLIAVYFLVTGITGLQLAGAENYVQSLFYGAALVAAVLAAVLAKKWRMKRNDRLAVRAVSDIG